MALIITFNVGPTRLASLVDAFKALGEWGMLTPTTYLIATDMSPGEAIARLHTFVAPDEDVWVISASGPWASYGTAEVEDHAEGLLGQPDDWTVWDWDDATSSRPRGAKIDL